MDEIKVDALALYLRFKDFSDGVRVVMLINRGIMNSNKGSRRWVNKVITTSSDEWLAAVTTLMNQQRYLNDPDVRLYACINDRKIDKAISAFKHKQIDLLTDMKMKFYSKINNTFVSCLMEPTNKNSKYFLLDVDSKDTTEIDAFVRDCKIELIKTYETPNGWHYIAHAFNVLGIPEDVKTFTVIKDGLMLLNCIEKEWQPDIN